MSTEDNKAIVRRFYDYYSAGDFAAAIGLWSEEGAWHGPGIAEVRGHSGLLQLAQQFVVAFPDLHDTVEAIAAEGDRVAVRLSSTATHLGPLQGIPPTGRPVVLHTMAIFRVHDGQIAEEWDQTDMLGMLQQIGLAPAATP